MFFLFFDCVFMFVCELNQGLIGVQWAMMGHGFVGCCFLSFLTFNFEVFFLANFVLISLCGFF